MTDSVTSRSEIDRDRLEQRLAEVDQDPRFKVDENHAEVSCRYCDEDHLGELYESPPDGYYVRYYCTNEERRGRRSYA